MKVDMSKLPQMGRLLESIEFNGLNSESVKKIAKNVLDELRKGEAGFECNLEDIKTEILSRYERLSKPMIKRLINATGVVVHTNLGRSPISNKALSSAFEIACGYCNLEYDLDKGRRGDRYGHLTRIANFLFGCEDILLVNNNAAAVFLILNTFAKNKECIVSRGELVEIGGGFRVPDVMANSGAKLVEVGTTNKTRLSDYKSAICENSAILMKVHQSNFAISGFTEEAKYAEIVELAKQSGLIDYYDLGSANIFDYKSHWASVEPSLLDILNNNPSLISFSSDKLLGSIQAGVILGSRNLIDKLKKNQLLRMLRCDKITISIIEQTLCEYAFGDPSSIPTVNMLSKSVSELRKRADAFLALLNNAPAYKVVDTKSYVGGGALPQEEIDSIAIALNSKCKPEKIIKILRGEGVIARIENDSVCLDMRTVADGEMFMIAEILNRCKI